MAFALLASALLGALASLVELAPSAGAPPEPAALEADAQWRLEGVEGCPSDEAFTQRLNDAAVDPRLRVNARVSEIQSSAGNAGASFHLELRAEFEGLEATWTLEDRDCEALVAAAVVTVAGSAPQRASATQPEPKPEPEPDCPDCQVPAAPPAPDEATPTEPKPDTSGESSPSDAEPPGPQTDPPEAAPTRPRPQLHRGAVVALGGAASLAQFAPLGAAVELRAGWHFGRASLHALGRWSPPTRVESSDGERLGRVDGFAGGLQGCAEFAPRAKLGADACAVIRAGAIRFRSEDASLRDRAGLWLDMGVAGGLVVWPTHRFGVGLRAEVASPLRATGFRSAQRVLLQPRYVYGALGADLRLRFGPGGAPPR